MIKSALKVIKKMVAVFALAIFAGVFFAACSPSTESSYTISGYVYDELGVAVKDVEIKSDLGSVFTDESGKYTVSGATSSLILQASKEGYQFAVTSKMVSKSTDDANFTAYKNYTVTGTVNSNGVIVPNATVKIESLSGRFFTTTDQDGVFCGKDVAGKATISCSKDGYDFYPVTADIASPEVLVSITTSMKINLKFDTNNIDYSDIKLFVNDKPQAITSSEIELTNIRCNSVIRLDSSKYNFSKKQFVVKSLNQVEEIVANECYVISGKVLSGNIPLSSAKVMLNGNIIQVPINSFGGFTLSETLTGDRIYGNNIVSVKHENYSFESFEVDNKTEETLIFNGTKDVLVDIDFDVNSIGELLFDGAEYDRLENNSYRLKNVHMGDVITVFSEEYHLSLSEFVISEDNSINIKAEAKYNMNVTIQDGLNVTILLDEKEVLADALVGLYGKHTISASYENYVFDKIEANYENSNITLKYVIPYSVTLNIVSGDILVQNATAIVNDKQILSQNGTIKLTNLINKNIVVIESVGYDSKELVIDEAGEYEVSLTYSVSGIVKTGSISVANAKVCAGEIETTTNTNGRYVLTGLTGKNIIEASKDYYDFNISEEVIKQSDVWISGTYNISGTLSDENGAASGITIVLRNDETADEERVISDVEGKYYFENLTESYFLYTLKNNSISGLKPNSYNVSVGGVYDFNLKGFAVSGRVISGNVPVSGAYVTAGSNSTLTDEAGNFTFELLTEACGLFVQKTGYDFSGSVIEVSEDTTGLVIEGTYSVSGTAKLSNLPLENVEIYANGVLVSSTNNVGEFTISGLSGQTEIMFTKIGYVFENEIVSQPSTLSISSKIRAILKVASGNNDVTNVNYYINGILSGIISSDSAEIIAEFGDRITFSKLGYVISEVVITEPKTYTANSTYSISGKVQSLDVAVSGVVISINGKTVTTNVNGEFTISGISGNVNLNLTKEGFSFAEVSEINEYVSDLLIQSSYNITGKILLGSEPNAGVIVTYNGTEFVSDKNGNFNITNITGNYTLSFEKEGYTFSEVSDKFGTSELVVNSFYIVVGRVMSGDQPVAFADVIATMENSSKIIYASSDANGNFEVTGLSGNAVIVITKNGYSSAQLADITNYTKNANVNLTYSVTIRFDTEGVLVIQNSDKKYQVNGKEIVIGELEGINIFTFEKKYTLFSRTSLTVNEPPETDFPTITTSEAYNITGQVKTSGGVVVSGIAVYAGSLSNMTLTDDDGRFAFTGVIGDLFIKDGTYSSESQRINAEKAYNFTIPDLDFAYYMYSKGYKNLDNAASVQIFGEGDVNAGAGGWQKVRSVFKRDNKGNIIKQNLNYGGSTLGIDPKVSLLVTYVASENAYKYTKRSGSGSVNDDLTANYTSLPAKADLNYFKEHFGAYPYEYSPYNVSKDTMRDVKISINSDGNYEISFSLTTSSQGNYERQIIDLAPSGSTFRSFSYLKQTYTITKEGWITYLYAEDKYTINKFVNAETISYFNYYFKTYASNLKIDDINVSSFEAIQKSLKESTQTEIAENLITNYCYDIVSKTIFG